jgi:Ni/Fe-hydrogenase b-type cytochrome subunit
MADGNTRDVVVMRGEAAAVVAATGSSWHTRSLARRNAAAAEANGARALAVAAAPVAEDGTVGAYRVQGVIGLHAVAEAKGESIDQDASWTRTTLWSSSLRAQHWLNVVLIFILSCTGYYIMDPFFGPDATNSTGTGYLMGYVRLIHFSAGFIWLVVGLTRLVLMFASRDRYLRWRTLWPLKCTEDVRNLGRVVGHYAFIKKEAPLYVAHNPLQQLAYTSLYAAGFLQMLTGFGLYGLAHEGVWVWDLVSSPVHLIGIGWVRLLHAGLMFLLWAFAIMHIYMAVRADSLERHGGVSSMINGGVWVQRGSRPVDAPEVE